MSRYKAARSLFFAAAESLLALFMLSIFNPKSSLEILFSVHGRQMDRAYMKFEVRNTSTRRQRDARITGPCHKLSKPSKNKIACSIITGSFITGTRIFRMSSHKNDAA
jgi:hypothetical protein